MTQTWVWEEVVAMISHRVGEGAPGFFVWELG